MRTGPSLRPQQGSPWRLQSGEMAPRLAQSRKSRALQKMHACIEEFETTRIYNVTPHVIHQSHQFIQGYDSLGPQFRMLSFQQCIRASHHHTEHRDHLSCCWLGAVQLNALAVSHSNVLHHRTSVAANSTRAKTTQQQTCCLVPAKLPCTAAVMAEERCSVMLYRNISACAAQRGGQAQHSTAQHSTQRTEGNEEKRMLAFDWLLAAAQHAMQQSSALLKLVRDVLQHPTYCTILQ